MLGDAKRAGFLTKWIGSDEVDGSLLSCIVPFGLLKPSDPLAVATIAKIRADILHDGVYRYRGDTFYGGGEWPILTAWLGWVEAAGGDAAVRRQRLDWIAAQATRRRIDSGAGQYACASTRSSSASGNAAGARSPRRWSGRTRCS